MERRTPWWRFALAIVSFVLIFFLAPILISMLLELTNLFSPKAFQNTSEWIYVISSISGIVLACISLEKILNGNHCIFCMIVCIIAAFYSVGVAVWNFAIGITELYEFLGLLAEGIVATVFAVIYGMHPTNISEGEEASKSQREIPRIITILAIVLFFAVGALQLYVANVSRVFNPSGKVYQCEQSIADEHGDNQLVLFFAEFTDDGYLNIIVADEYLTAIGKNSYDYNYRVWNNIGNLYFKTDSLLSVTVFKENAIPVTIEADCVQSRGFYSNENASFATYENPDEIGVQLTSEAWFYEDSLVLDGITFQQIDDIDLVYKEMIRLFIDDDDNFAENLVE